MNKLIFPTILSGIILFAVVFAYFPVNNASTVHTTVGNTATILELQKTLPTGGADITWTIECTASGNVITAIWVDNSPTDDLDNADFDLVDFEIAGTNYKAGALTLEISDDEFVLDLLGELEGAINNPLGLNPIPCPAGDTVTLDFDNSDTGNDVIINLIVSVQGPDGVELT